MNLVDAVKELTTNPEAIAITFNNGKRRLVLMGEYTLAYPSGGEFQANNPKFLLRNDFKIEYKPSPYRELTASEIKVRVNDLLHELERRAK